MELCEKGLCNGCSACMNVCPKKCIHMIEDEEGFLQPEIDAEKCVSCGKCQIVCPVINPPGYYEEKPECYAAYNNSKKERLVSSSGGVFSVLAKYVLENDGVVFGAAFTDSFVLKHQFVEKREDLPILFGSKYIQSEIGFSYAQAKDFLDKGRLVLFSGTPCQIIGLKKYLDKNYNNLLTVDFFCHGVPSPGVWSHYLKYRSDKDNGGVFPKEIYFRKKVRGWTDYYTCFDYGDKAYGISHFKDPYMQGFRENIYLRASCYNCIAKGVCRVSDITLADYWGVRNLCPKMYDNKGTSLVLINSENAKKIWDMISFQMKIRKTNLEKAIQSNIAAVHSVKCHTGREVFFKSYKSEDFESLIWHLAPYRPKPRKPLNKRLRATLSFLYHRLAD